MIVHVQFILREFTINVPLIVLFPLIIISYRSVHVHTHRAFVVLIVMMFECLVAMAIGF